MLLSGALFALFMMGFWLYCLTDAVLTPVSEFRGMPKPAWIAVITLTFIGGGRALLLVQGTPGRHTLTSLGGAVPGRIVREPLRSPPAPPESAPRPDDPGNRYFRRGRWTYADDAVARHPAGRARASATTVPAGPDDDPEFLRALERAIRGNSQAGGEGWRPGGPGGQHPEPAAFWCL